jgi:hypothetical protein
LLITLGEYSFIVQTGLGKTSAMLTPDEVPAKDTPRRMAELLLQAVDDDAAGAQRHNMREMALHALDVERAH